MVALIFAPVFLFSITVATYIHHTYMCLDVSLLPLNIYHRLLENLVRDEIETKRKRQKSRLLLDFDSFESDQNAF